MKKLMTANFGLLCAYCYRHINLKELILTIDIITFLFCYDDFVDNLRNDISIRPKIIEKCNKKLFEILFEGKKPNHSNPIERALYDITNRILQEKQDPKYVFLEFKNYFSSIKSEINNRKCNYLPNVKDYLKLRQFTGGVYFAFEIGYLTSGIAMHNNLRNNYLIKKMLKHANNYICVVNDLFSFKKEYTSKLTDNYVYITHVKKQISIEEAIYETIEFLEEEFKRYEETVKKIVDQNCFNDPNVSKQINIVNHWIRGNIDWSMNTARYTYS